MGIDPAAYERHAATVDEPFKLAADGQLYEPTLDQELDDQLAAGADFALTPTGFFFSGARAELKVAAKSAAGIDREDTIFSVPLAIAWLNTTYIDQLIAVLRRVRIPKAIFLGSQLDPLDNVTEAVANLRRLVSELDQVSVLRTDFAAFDVTATGALAASIGTGGSLRHIVPPDERPYSPMSRKDRSPTVFVPELIHFYRGSTLAKRYANTPAPACHCKVCGDRRIDTFLADADRSAAHQHGVRAWMEWLPDLLDQPTTSDRFAWWQGKCKSAVDNHEIYNQQIKLRGAFEPPNPLLIWSGQEPRKKRAAS